MKVTMLFLKGSVLWPAVREITCQLHHQQLAFWFIFTFDLFFSVKFIWAFYPSASWTVSLLVHFHFWPIFHFFLLLFSVIFTWALSPSASWTVDLDWILYFALVVFTIFLPFGTRGVQSKNDQLYKVDCPTLQKEYICIEFFMLFLNFRYSSKKVNFHG